MSAAAAATNPLEEFFQLCKTLMAAVKATFPECEKTQMALEQLEFIETSGMTSMKETLIRTWYSTMKPFVQDCVQKNDHILLRSNIKFLDDFDLKSKWSDPDFDQESKDVLWEYINNLNYLSIMYSESSPEHMDGLTAVASRLAETAQLEISEDGKLSFNLKALQSLLTSENAQGDLASLMPLAAPLMENLMGGAGAGGEGGGLQAFLQAQMASMLGQLKPQ
jgi:hypothetical protein